jgi:copper chaperone CopZ
MKNSKVQKSCCEKTDSRPDKKGFISGILYGLIPHTFCIAFIIFTVLGVTTATALLKPLLLNRYFFYILIGLSIVFATISAIIYLKRNRILSLSGIKRKWKYLSILYGTTIFVNLLFFMVIFPKVANLNLNPTTQTAALIEKTNLSSITLKVDIPCPGHAPLITTELKKISGVEEVKFSFPNLFVVKYNFLKTSKGEILSLEVFNTYKAMVINETTSQTDNPQPLTNSEQPSSNVGSYQCCGGVAGGCGCGCGRR